MSESAALEALNQGNVTAFITGELDVGGVSYEDLVARHGSENVNAAFANIAINGFAQETLDSYLGTPMASEARTIAYEQLEALLLPTTTAAQLDVDALYADIMRENALALLEETEEDLSTPIGGPGSNKKAAAAGGMNWLIAMAKALGAAAGQYLARSVELAMEMANVQRDERDFRDASGNLQQRGNLSDAEQAARVTELQAEMQANTQMFKMVFEAAATAIKTFGESFSTMARKQ